MKYCAYVPTRRKLQGASPLKRWENKGNEKKQETLEWFHRRKCPRTTAVVQWTPKNQKPVSYTKKSNYREELCLKICTRPEHSEHQWTMANIKKVKITSKEQLRFQSRYEWCDKKKVSEILRSWCIHWGTRYLGCRQLKGVLKFYLRFGKSYHASEVRFTIGFWNWRKLFDNDIGASHIPRFCQFQQECFSGEHSIFFCGTILLYSDVSGVELMFTAFIRGALLSWKQVSGRISTARSEWRTS